MSQWTFVTNHTIVLSLISRHSVITGHELALKIGISERAVRRIIAELEDAGYIKKKKEGRRVRYQVKDQTPLRHKTQRDKAVGALLKIFNPPQEKEKKRQS
jgi:DNA-binding transcriptional ArsR family regulator